jgi:hypothetical protein
MMSAVLQSASAVVEDDTEQAARVKAGVAVNQQGSQKGECRWRVYDIWASTKSPVTKMTGPRTRLIANNAAISE